MPLLSRPKELFPEVPPDSWQKPWPTASGPPRSRLFEACGNPRCSSGWLHVWRSRSAPIFEGRWSCSPVCTAERLEIAVRRELSGRTVTPDRHRHRVPLGLLMLEQGWITEKQLRSALEGQRSNGAGRLGHWLMAREGIDEALITRALGLQWSCPVLPLVTHDPEGLAPMLPRFFVDAFGALVLRLAAGKVIYLGFEDRLDPVLALALERMSGLSVESGIVQGSQFSPAHARMLESGFPAAELVEAVSEPALVRALARRVEQFRPVEARLVRVHDCLWLRLWRAAQTGPIPAAASVTDVICTIGPT